MMKTQRIRFCLLVLGAAAVVASVPAATQTLAASAGAKKSTASNAAKQKCTQQAQHGAPGVNQDAEQYRREIYINCMRRATGK
jgi:hypothetical protein